MNIAQKIDGYLKRANQWASAGEAVRQLDLPILKEWISGTTRWSVVNSLVTEYEGALYKVVWHEPATEDGEFEQDQWTVIQVRPVESVDYVEV